MTALRRIKLISFKLNKYISNLIVCFLVEYSNMVAFHFFRELFCLVDPPEHQPHEDIFMDKKSN